jgi:hypothetical protein
MSNSHQPTHLLHSQLKTTQKFFSSKSFFQLLKLQIEQTLVLPEFPPLPPPTFCFGFLSFGFFLGFLFLNIPKSPKNIKNDISITWNLVQEKILHEEIIAYFELRMACQIAPFVYLVIMHTFVPPPFFSSSISNCLNNT